MYTHVYYSFTTKYMKMGYILHGHVFLMSVLINIHVGSTKIESLN